LFLIKGHFANFYYFYDIYTPNFFILKNSRISLPIISRAKSTRLLKKLLV